MKIAIECKSLLLQKSLEVFLEPYLSSIKQCDVIVCDFKSSDKKSFYISQEIDADLIKPFSKSSLIMALEARCSALEDKEDDVLDFEVLQKRIESLTKEYQDNILKTVKAFYEK
ncbi:MAG: hypothetical protein GXO30_00545 [Epsilonproteobacteria bacterium]|nr:hypothetical protein [Campylobacterota bacterium]